MVCTNPGMPMSSPGHGVGPAHVWIEITACATKCSLVSGRLSRLLGLKLEAGRTVRGFIYAQLARTKDYSWDATCLEPSRNAAGAVAGAAARHPSSLSADHSSNGPKKPMTDRLLAIGRLT